MPGRLINATDVGQTAGGALAKQLRTDGWVICATNPATFQSYSAGSTTPVEQTAKTRHIATVNASRLMLLFANYCPVQGQSVNGNYNDITVGASLQKAGSTTSDQSGFIYPASFPNGRLRSTVSPLALIATMPAFFRVAKDEAFFINTYSANHQPPAPSSAPTLTEVLTGGTLTGGATFNVCFTYVFRDGYESATSASAAITLTAGANTRQITVTAPPSVAGAVGYRCYLTGANDVSGGVYYPISTTTPFGTNASISVANSIYNQRQTRAGGLIYVPYGIGTAGGTIFAGLDTGEGQTNGDQTLNGGSVTILASAAVYSPVAILGKVIGSPPATFALIGDSIQGGTGDQGFVGNAGGFGARAMTAQTALCYAPSTSPTYGYVRVPQGGEKASQFANQLSTNQFERTRLEISELASNILSNYGVNDLSDGLSAVQTAILNLAAWYASRGIKFYQCTLVPKTTSTDAWRTVANQTTTAVETVRVNFNNWLRDTSASGFKQQSGYPSLVSVIDICANVEVNSSGVLTQNGGYWIVPPTSPNITGTFTSVSSNSQFTDNTKSWTRQAYKGNCVIVTSGAQANKLGCIFYNDATGTMNTGSSIGGTPSIGDAYVITNVATIDGTHPSSWSHVQMAASVTAALAADPPIN